MTEVKTLEYKERVNKIMKDRKKYVEMIHDIVNSDENLCPSNSLSKEFLNYLLEKKAIKHYHEEKTERSPRNRTERKQYKKEGKKFYEIRKTETVEYITLYEVEFRDEKRIHFGTRYSHQTQYILNGIWMLEANSEEWKEAKRILDIIIPYVPKFIEDHYKKELHRICPMNENIVCESCGFKNDKCNKFCGECGNEL